MVRQPPSSPLLAVLLEQYEHDGIQTCAADGICSSSCPVGIDTGTLIKELRRRERTPREEAAGLRLAQRYEAVERVARGCLRAGHLAASVLGQRAVAEIPAAVRRRVSTDLVPTWPASMPPAAPGRLPDTSRDGAAAVLPARVYQPDLWQPRRPRLAPDPAR
jgi:D-lactate dehydrogenase